jgi:arylsulfatase A-like enzyme
MRYAFEYNPAYDPNDHKQGVSTHEKMLPKYLAEKGYATGWIGKWHLGAAPEFKPENRGFQETFGFIGGGHQFINWQPSTKEYLLPIERQGKPVEVTQHLTREFGLEASRFIQRHENHPWFLYLAFNAPHMPNQPTPERLQKFMHIKDPTRRAYAAQVSLMDDAIGETLQALKRSGQLENTLVFFMSDNGGQTYSGADNTPLRDKKGTAFEGGVRVPFLVSWPGKLPANKEYDGIVSALDVLPTALVAAGIHESPDKPLDGVDLIPYLSGAKEGTPHEVLYWRHLESGQWAIRNNDWKLVARTKDWRNPGATSIPFSELSLQLFNVKTDMRERLEFTNNKKEKTIELKKLLEEWGGEIREGTNRQ